MDNRLQQLREKNPGLRLHSVLDEAFAPYGRVLALDGTAELSRAMAETPIPAEGNRYAASVPVLEACPAAETLRWLVFGGMETQNGYCNGHSFMLNALEYHKCSEVNYTTTGLVLLLALPEQLRDGALDSADAAGFYLPPEVPVEIFPRVLHFAPCRVQPSGFNCLVALERGTNEALDLAVLPKTGEQKLLWMKNKWLTCHPDSPQAAKGAYPGITGENLRLNI